MKIKDKRKFLSFFMILGITIILFVVGYFVNIGNNVGEDIFKDYEKNKTQLVYSQNKKEENNVSKVSLEDETCMQDKGNEKKEKYIKVDIKGAVKKPKVYTINEDKRVCDLIDLAGGLMENADTLRINMSKKLQDEEVIYVYYKGEDNKEEILNSVMNKGENVGNAGDNRGDNKGKNNKSNKININIASKEELKTLPGIGDTRANSIIEYREQNNGFKSIDEFKNISGIGDKTISKFAHMVDIK